MIILKKNEFKKLLEDNPKKRFIFMEFNMNDTELHDVHFSNGGHECWPEPTFGAITLVRNTDLDSYNDGMIWDYDWNIDEYSDDDQFVVFTPEDVQTLKQLVDESM